MFVWDLNSCIREDKARNIIIEVMLKSEISDRLDLSAEFYEQFNCQNENLRKRLGFFEIENINKPNVILSHQILKNIMNVLVIIQITKNTKG